MRNARNNPKFLAATSYTNQTREVLSIVIRAAQNNLRSPAGRLAIPASHGYHCCNYQPLPRTETHHLLQVGPGGSKAATRFCWQPAWQASCNCSNPAAKPMADLNSEKPHERSPARHWWRSHAHPPEHRRPASQLPD